MTTNTPPSGADALREKLTDIIADHLSGTYHCNRVWEAWNVGTMSQDDFEDVGESDTPAELADVILAALSAAQDAPAEAAQAVPPVVNNAIRQLIAYSEGSKSAEIVRHCRELSSWVAAAPAAQAVQAVPEGKVLVDRGALNMVINALRRDAAEGRVVRGEMVDALLSAAPAAPQPAAPVHPGDDAVFELWWADHMPNASQSEAWAEWCSLRANQPEPQPSAQQGWDIDAAVEKAWGRFQAAMDKDEPLPPPSVHAAAHYGTWLGREAHRHDEPRAGAFRNAARMLAVLESEVRRLHAELLAAQAHEAAPAAQGEPSDPLQGAANWLLEAIGGCNIRTLEWHLRIDFNRAERLMLAARAAQQKGGAK